MKTFTVAAISAILVTAVVLPAINSAQAAPQIRTVEDGRLQLSPKAFGPNTSLYLCDNGKCFNVDMTQKGTYSEIKKEELKAYKKAVALHEAYKFMKSYYKNHKTGF